MKKASSLSITIFLSPTTGPFKAATATSYKTPTYDYYYTTHTLHIFKEMCHYYYYYYSMSKIFDAMTFLINLITALLCVCVRIMHCHNNGFIIHPLILNI